MHTAADPLLDAWRGAAQWAATAPPSAYVTLAEYRERGADYFVEHFASNHLTRAQPEGV